MELVTNYGILKMEINENEIKVFSDIPFMKFEKEFPLSEIKNATEFFKSKKSEIEKIIQEMEEKKKKKLVHDSGLFNKVYNLIVKKNARKILLYGPTGTGKTFSVLSVCKKLKEERKINDYLLFHMSSGMEDIDLLGKFIPQENKTLKFEESELVKFIKKATKEKVVIILDEFNRAHSKALNILIPLLDEKDNFVYLNNYINNEIIKVPSHNLIFMLTANFGGNYIGTYKVDSAILNRIEYSIFVDYQDKLEQELISYLPKDKQKIVLEIRNFLRELYKEGSIEPFSTRDLKIMAKEISYIDLNFESIWNAIEPIVYKLIKVDMFGYPDEELIEQIKEFIKKLIEGGE